MRRGIALACVTLCVAPAPLTAQRPEIRGYYLHAAAAVEATALSAGGAFDFQRLRLMTTPRLAAFALDVAYEHVVELRTADFALASGFEGAEAASPWLPLQGTITEGRRGRWRHGLDRLAVLASIGEQARISAGRQTVSWATTLFFTPADPFAPFDPADPFREFRGGIDAARVQLFPGPMSQLDAVVRPARTADGTTLTALARLSVVLAGVEMAAWGGALHDKPAAALAASATPGDWALRGEATLRSGDADEGAVLRAAFGVDRRALLAGRDLHLVLEYLHDGFGARSADELLAVAGSAPFRRGEMQTLGSDAATASASWDAHPLVRVDVRALSNLRDGSVLLAPGATYSAGDEVSVRVGAFAGLGPGISATPPRAGSEYGVRPAIAYVALSVFF
jgi:hypothetical protein